MKDLGECIYQKDFSTKIVNENDGNGHLNNGDYSSYSEEIRIRFLESFNWSDKRFNDDFGVSMRMGQRKIRYRLPLKKDDEVKINLQVYFKRNPFFHMVYTFYTPSGEEAAVDTTLVGFVDSKTEKAIVVPEFFIKELKDRKLIQNLFG